MKKDLHAILERNFPIDYRADVIEQIVLHIKNMESFSLIGMEDNCKTNVLRFLALREDVQKKYKIDSGMEFLYLDLNELPGESIESFYYFLAKHLSKLEGIQDKYEIPQNTLDAFDFCKNFLANYLETGKNSLVIGFNNFDLLNSNAQILAKNLTAIRQVARFRLMYIFSANRPLNGNDLFYQKIVWMTPFNGNDALGVVDRNAHRYQMELNNEEKQKIIYVSGGHAGMIKFIVQTLANNKISLENLDLYQDKSDLYFQCDRIVGNLTELEKAQLKANIKNDLLINLGTQRIINNQVQIFSPIMEKYLQIYPSLVKTFVYDQENNQIYHCGESVKKILSNKEFSLLKLMLSDSNKIVGRDEIINQLWTDEVDITDWAIDKFISRLREKLNTESIKTVKGRGWYID